MLLKMSYDVLLLKHPLLTLFGLGGLNRPIRLGGGSIWPPLKSRRWGQKSPRLWLHIDIWFLNSVLSHFGARYDKKWKIYQSKFEKSEKKIENFWDQKFRVRHARYRISTPGTRCTRLNFFLKNGYIYITDFMFQNLAKFGGGVNLTPLWTSTFRPPKIVPKPPKPYFKLFYSS